MSSLGDTFFTALRCMDGRCEELVSQFGKNKFGAEYPDTITEAGLVKIIAHNPSREFITQLKTKIDISVNKHHSKGIVVCGHAECAGNPVDDEKHKNDVRVSVKLIQSFVGSVIPVVGVFVKRSANGTWIVEEV
ncbi:MAG: hypothetical protein HYW64_01265 [Candidatus Levybacteria bacterium]|nr:hypothetical protein [Candidatus Levybacteria bacterium]MBI2622705.1 hypothetical protein [Candidatus Levybacteria bacterium]MBI3092685.1 hypothetical protein [Candidatus Levybacteria bacterium]